MKTHFIIKLTAPSGETQTIKVGHRAKFAKVKQIARNEARAFHHAATFTINETQTFRGVEV